MISRFEDLAVWKCSVRLSADVYKHFHFVKTMDSNVR